MRLRNRRVVWGMGLTAVMVVALSAMLPGLRPGVMADAPAVLTTPAVPTAPAALTAGMGDGSVRVLTAGPVALTTGDSASSRLLLPAVQLPAVQLPAVQRPWAQVLITDGTGNVLLRKRYQAPAPVVGAPAPGPFFGVSFDIDVSDTEVVFTDRDGRQVISAPAGGEAVLGVIVEVHLPAIQRVTQASLRAHLGAMQIVKQSDPIQLPGLPDPLPGQPQTIILPYIEQ